MGFLQKIFGGGSKKAELDNIDWKEKIKVITVFSNIPDDALTEMSSRMEAIHVNAGDVIIRQGEEGQHFYVLAQGSAEVERQSSSEAAPVILAELKSGACFGEEALISNAKRNATITMQTSGVLLRLAKSYFDSLIKEPKLNWISKVQAQKIIDGGGKWLDVRVKAEFQMGSLPGANSMPLSELRNSCQPLEKSVPYICFCRT